jgi:hypothetical protein
MFYVEIDSGQCTSDNTLFTESTKLPVNDNILNYDMYALSVENTVHKVFENVEGISKKLINIDL